VKKTCMALFLATLILPLGFDAAAQQSTTTGDMKRDSQRAAWQKPAEAMESTKLIGARVKGADGKDVGEIDSLVVSKDGKVSHVIVGKGGVAGIGETKVVVPWSDVKVGFDRDRDNPVITMDPAALDRAPKYERRAARDDRTPAASPGTSPSSPGTSPSKEKTR
jgi:sporulation protein YlmC with PRC-barrel domain